MGKLTMTLREVQLDLRSRGANISQARLSARIKSGQLPFGKVINIGETGRATFVILRSTYEKWAEENL